MTFLRTRPFLVFTNSLAYELWHVEAGRGRYGAVRAVHPPSAEIIRPAEKSLSKYLASIIPYVPAMPNISPAHCGLAVNTTLGCAHESKEFLRVMYDKGFHCASPMKFPQAVNSSLLGVASRSLGIEGDAVLLIGENALAFGLDVLSRESRLDSCLCISIDGFERDGKISQYCSIAQLTARAEGSWRHLASIIADWSAQQPADLRRLIHNAAERVEGAAFLIYASGDSVNAMLEDISGLRPNLAGSFICSIAAEESAGSFISCFLMELADHVAPCNPAIVVHKNHLSMLEVTCIGPRQAPAAVGLDMMADVTANEN